MPTGRELNQRWGVGARHALYRETGDWYHVLKRFPGALFDANGYVRLESRNDLEMPGVSVSKENGKDWLSVPGGIAALPGYRRARSVEGPNQSVDKPEGVALREHDESERLAVQRSGTLAYRHLHNKMTNTFGQMFAALKPEQGQMSNNRYDVLIRGYDGAGRDLLVEAKPDPNKGSLRIAIGQLYDYRRFLRNRVATDLAVLTIGKPHKSYIDLLVSDRSITALWFEDETCKRLYGKGSAWSVLRPRNQLK
jgi:5-methylcytosine-specific restriction protein A